MSGAPRARTTAVPSRWASRWTIPPTPGSSAAAVLRRGRLPRAERPRGGVAVHPAGAAARPARRHRRGRPARLRVEVTAPEGVTVETVDRADAAGRHGGHARSTGSRAQALQRLREGVGGHRRPRRPCSPSRSGSPCTARAASPTATWSSRSAPFAEAVVVLDHTGAATLAANVEFLVGDGAKLTVVSVQDWDDDAVHVAAARRAGRPGRRASSRVVVTFGGDLVRLHPPVRLRAAPAATPSCSACTSPTPASTRSTGSSSTTTTPHCRSNVAYKGALQGQDAHAVWIGDVLIRAAAEGTDTYELNRNLRAHRRRPGRLGAQPGDRDRRDRRRRPRQRDRPLRRRAAVLPDGPRHPARTRPAAWWCAASSPSWSSRSASPDVEERLLAKIEAELEASVG